MSNLTTKGNRATARGTCRCRERHRKFLRTGKSSHGEFLGWAVRGEMPRGRVVTTEAAELAVGTVKPRAHGSDPRPHDASDLPVSEAVDISWRIVALSVAPADVQPVARSTANVDVPETPELYEPYDDRSSRPSRCS